MDEEEISIIYRKCLKFITYIPAQGYLWIDRMGEWHGLFETENQAVSAFAFYLKNTKFDD